MRQQSGCKAFILLTDGVSFRDKSNIGTAIEFAQRADTILFAIRFSGPNSVARPVRAMVQGMASQGGKHALERMAAETGGAALEVSFDKPIEKLYSEVEESLRNRYSIGYTPARKSDPGKFHGIKLTVKRRDVIVRTRARYYARGFPVVLDRIGPVLM